MAVKKSSSEKGASRKKSAVQNGGKPVLVEQNGGNTTSFQREHATITIETEIRRRAYEIYESRGRQDGLDRDDWIQAEAEILSRRKQSA